MQLLKIAAAQGIGNIAQHNKRRIGLVLDYFSLWTSTILEKQL